MTWSTEMGLVGYELLDYGSLVEVPTWHAQNVTDKPQGKMHEVTDYTFRTMIPDTPEALALKVEPNLPWAENHFLERVSGEPLNPPPSEKEWPWATHNQEHQEETKFSHTYPERYWPRTATFLMRTGARTGDNFAGWWYGDLGDVVDLLEREPTTRQAFLPVWFPCDTGAVHKQRVPCSLGYLFLMREGKLNITYYIRSCDFYRHFRDDVYMTARLVHWMLKELQDDSGDSFDYHNKWNSVVPGRLTMHIGSLHIFEAELPRLEREYGSY